MMRIASFMLLCILAFAMFAGVFSARHMVAAPMQLGAPLRWKCAQVIGFMVSSRLVPGRRQSELLLLFAFFRTFASRVPTHGVDAISETECLLTRSQRWGRWRLQWPWCCYPESSLFCKFAIHSFALFFITCCLFSHKSSEGALEKLTRFWYLQGAEEFRHGVRCSSWQLCSRYDLSLAPLWAHHSYFLIFLRTFRPRRWWQPRWPRCGNSRTARCE